MKNFSDTGKDSEMPLYRAPTELSLRYMYLYVWVWVCVCLHSVKSHSPHACKDLSEQICRLQFPESAQQTPHFGRVWLRMTKFPGCMWTTLSMEIQGILWQNHPRTKVRLLTAHPFLCLSTPSLLGIITFSSSKVTHTEHSRLCGPLLSPNYCALSYPHIHLSVGQKLIFLAVSQLR